MSDRTITAEMAGLIKGMLLRGDDQSDIAAAFLLNIGRVSEINTGKRFAEVTAAPAEDLPPAGPYPSPYDLWRMRQGLWTLRATLKAAAEKMELLLSAIEKLEKRIEPK